MSPGSAEQLVRVDWVDPWSHGGWVEKEDIEAAASRDLACVSVGWILRETDDRLVLAGSRTVDGFGDLFALPRCVIESVTPLRPRK